MFCKNSKSIGAIMAFVMALAFMAMPISQVQAQETAITGAVENIGSALGGMVEGLTNTLSSDFIMSIVESISMRIGRVFGAGLFVASTDNIFFRVLEWIVAFVMVISSQILWEVLNLIYLIPCVSMVGSITQPLLFFEFMYPLISGIPFLFVDNFEGGFSWLNMGSTSTLGCVQSFLAFILYLGGGGLHIAYAILMLIPILNILVAIGGLIVSAVCYPFMDIVLIIQSILFLLQNSIPSTITDCVIISRAMCRACLGV